jgi:hypothetical protein
MPSFEEMVPRPLLPAFVTKGPGFQHSVRRNDVRDTSTPAGRRDAQEAWLPESVKVHDVRRSLFHVSVGRVGTNKYPGLPQVPFERANRELEPTGSLRPGGLIKVDVHTPETSL